MGRGYNAVAARREGGLKGLKNDLSEQREKSGGLHL
jgi:hypothetical protein